MEFFHKETKIDFMRMRTLNWTLSAIVTILSLWMLYAKGLNFGLDFTGGTQIELRLSQNLNIEEIRERLEQNGLDGVKVAQYGSTKDILIKYANKKGVDEDKLSEEVVAILKAQDPQIEVRKIDFVGAEVGENLAQQGALAVFVALLAT